MFGDFMKQFNLDFPFTALDAQGGLFGANAPQEGQPPLGGPAAPGGAGTGLNISTPAPASAPGPAGPGTITPPKMTDPGQAGLPQQQQPQQSPLASPLAPGGGAGFGQLQPQPQPDPAPAAGVGNQFNKAGF